MLFFSNHVDFTFPIFDETKLPITHSALHHHFGVARVALVQVEMKRAEAVKEELVKFVFLGKVLDARP